MPTNYITSEGDMLDAICHRHYGRQSGAVEAVLEANRNLAELAYGEPHDIASQGDRAYQKMLAMAGAGYVRPGFILTMREIPIGDSGEIEWSGTYQLNGFDETEVVLELMVVSDIEYEMDTTPLNVAGSGGVWSFTPAYTGVGTKIVRLRALPTVEYPDGQILAEVYPDRGIIKSYQIPQGETSNGVDLWAILHDRCFTYDQAVAVCAAVARIDQANAEKLVQGLMWCQVPQSYPVGQRGRIPFSVNANGWLPDHQWVGLIDPYFRTGAEMWCAYAFAWFAKTFPNSTLTPAVRAACQTLLDALIVNCYVVSSGDYRDRLFIGGNGQYSADYGTFDPDYAVPWVSTEHTIDAYHAFTEAVAAGIETEATSYSYTDIAAGLAERLQTVLWSDAAVGNPTPRAYQGTLAAAKDTAHALDCGSWLSLALRRVGASLADKALATVAPYAVTYQGRTLYTPYLPSLGYPDTSLAPWGEGSAGVALALRAAGDIAGYQRIMRDLAVLESNLGYLYVATDIAPYELQDWPSAASTAWVALAARPNGFWGIEARGRAVEMYALPPNVTIVLPDLSFDEVETVRLWD